MSVRTMSTGLVDEENVLLQQLWRRMNFSDRAYSLWFLGLTLALLFVPHHLENWPRFLLLNAAILEVIVLTAWKALEGNGSIRGYFIRPAKAAAKLDEGGAVGLLQSNWRVGARQLRMEMHGNGISCLVTPEEGAIIYEAGKPVEQLVASGLTGGPESWRIGFLQEARHFIDCILQERDPLLNVEWGLHITEMMAGAAESAATGQKYLMTTSVDI